MGLKDYLKRVIADREVKVQQIETTSKWEKYYNYVLRQAAKGSKMHNDILQAYHANANPNLKLDEKALKFAREEIIKGQGQRAGRQNTANIDWSKVTTPVPKSNYEVSMASRLKSTVATAGKKAVTRGVIGNAALAGSATKEVTQKVVSGAAQGAASKLGVNKRLTGRYIKCRYCGEEYSITYERCPNVNIKGEICGEPNPYFGNAERGVSLSHTAGKRVNARIYEAFIFVMAGIAALFVPSMLGLPSFPYLAIALMVFMPAYILLPGEHDILKSLGSDENLGGEKAALLFPKAGAKIMAFAFILFQLVSINLIITIILALVFYFSMPLRYKTSQPYRIIESWSRMAFGVVIAILFFMAFGGVSNPVGFSLGLMSAAFFATLPVQIEDTEEGKLVVVLSQKYRQVLESPLEKVLFFILMIASLISVASGVAWTWTLSQIMFVSVWGLSLITGLTAGPEGRPAIGILMIFIALFAFSNMYTGYVGSAIFGYWWPQIESFGEAYLTPLTDAWSQAQNGMSDTWLIMTNPQEYYRRMAEKQQLRSVVKTGGTTKSVELNKIDLFPSIIGILEPTEPIIGSIELENQGEFEAGKIDLSISAVWKDPLSLGEITAGQIGRLQCSNAFGAPHEGNPAYCNWTGRIYPQEMKSVTFVLQENSWIEGGISNCEDEGGPCTCFDCTPGNATYAHGGESVKVYTNLSYNYNVNVSLPFEIINSELYMRKLKAGEIVLKELTSEYSGGPVKATLWTPKQPARTGEPYMIVASIYNDGSGLLTKISEFKVKVPKILVYEGGTGGGPCQGTPIQCSSFYWNMIDGNCEDQQHGCTDPVSGSACQGTPDPCSNFYWNGPGDTENCGQRQQGCSNPSSTGSPVFTESIEKAASTFRTGLTDDGCNEPIDEGNEYVITCSNTYGVLKNGEYKRVSIYITPSASVNDIRTGLIVGLANYDYSKTSFQSLTIANAPPQ